MKKYIGFILLNVALSLTVYSQEESIYSFSFQTITEKKIELTAYKGKPMAILILGTNRCTDSIVGSFDSLAQRQKGKWVTVLAPASNNAPDNLQQKEITRLITGRTNNITLIAAASSKKVDQSASRLLKWLSSKGDNKHFDFSYDENSNVLVLLDKAGAIKARLADLPNFSSEQLTRILKGIDQ